MTIRLLAALAVTGFAASQLGNAQVTHSEWTSAQDGDWASSPNWSSAHYPDNGTPNPDDTYEAVLADFMSMPYQVVVGPADGDIAVATLVITDAVSLLLRGPGPTQLTVVDGFDNPGRIALASLSTGGSSSTLKVMQGTLRNLASGIIQSTPGEGTRTLDAQIENVGLISIQFPTTLWNDRAAFSSVDGHLEILTGQSLMVHGGSFDHRRGFITGGGKLRLSGSTGLLAGTAHLQQLYLSDGARLYPSEAAQRIGTLAIDGDYVQDESSALLIETAEPGRNDLLEIAGTATLAGTLRIVPLHDAYSNVHAASAGSEPTHTILHANQGITGTFSRVIAPRNTRVEYTAFDVVVRFR